MKFTALQGELTTVKTDVIIISCFEGVKSLSNEAKAVDKALGGIVLNEVKHNDNFTGKTAQTLVIHTHNKISARYVVLVGLGNEKDATSFQIRRASAAAVRACKSLSVTRIATSLHSAGKTDLSTVDVARLIAEGSLMGSYRFDQWKTKASKSNTSTISNVSVVSTDKKQLNAIKKGLTLGEIIARSTNAARDYVNDSANHVTPTFLKMQAEAIKGLKVKSLDFKDIKRLKMGLFESVTKGSDEPPFLIHMQYKPTTTAKSGAKKKAPKKITLVGKGITFDSGGLSLKPAASMATMKLDMGGAAAVLGTMKAIAELSKIIDIPYQIDGFIGTCENLPSGRASKPGDICVSRRGKTVEIVNTDAEGRLVLGDVLHYAQEQVDPDEMIDLATLTGACVAALGHPAAGLMGTNDTFLQNIIQSGKASGENFVHLPFFDEYKQFLKSPVADITNSGSKGEAGSQHAGMFLKEFIDEGRTWAHMDIAGPAFINFDYPEIPKGGSGFGVRTLVYYLAGLA